MSEYSKIVLNIEEQIELLKSRKLIFDDLDKARKYLTHIGYYRLSQYFKANQFFEIEKKEIVYKNLFKDDIHFKDIIDLYKFDRELRLIVMDMVERVEISIRSVVINELSLNKLNPFCYLDEHNYKNKQAADYIKKRIRENIASKKFQKHEVAKNFNENYQGSDYPPIWMILNTSEFGLVTNIYKNLNYKKKKLISKQYSLDADLFGQKIEVIRTIRNIVSHHERLFNRSFSYGKNTSIKFHEFINEINYLKNQIVPTSEWNERVIELYTRYGHLDPVNKYKYES